MRIGLLAALAGGLALAGCAYPYGAPGYGYGGGYGYGYSSPAYYAQGYGYSPAYVQPYGVGVYAGGGQWDRGGDWHGNDWHGQGWQGQPRGGWNGQPRPEAYHPNVYQRSTQPAQRAATPQTRQFERDLGFRPNP